MYIYYLVQYKKGKFACKVESQSLRKFILYSICSKRATSNNVKMKDIPYPAQYNPRVSVKRWALGKILQEYTIRSNLQIGCGTAILSEIWI